MPGISRKYDPRKLICPKHGNAFVRFEHSGTHSHGCPACADGIRRKVKVERGRETKGKRR